MMNFYIILFFILAVSLYIYTRYIRLKKQAQQEKQLQIEAFESTQAAYASLNPLEKLNQRHNIHINFKSASVAAKIIQTQCREYITMMNQPNLAARGFQSQSELLSAYPQQLQDITPAEQSNVADFILELLDMLESKYPAYYRYLVKWLSKISLAKAQSSLEGGMPHTLGSMAIMDAVWFARPRATTFLHELTHIHQREVPFEFEDLYAKWGYVQTSISDIRGMESVLQLNRNNPDGTSPNWVWRNSNTGDGRCWWIGAIFQSAAPESLGDVSLIAIRLELDAQGNYYYLKQQPQPLDRLQSFVTYFGGANPNNYHPNEMAARFSEVFLDEMLGKPNPQEQKSPGYQIYRNHMNKLIGTYY